MITQHRPQTLHISPSQQLQMDQRSSHSIKQLPFIDTQKLRTHCTCIVSLKQALYKIIIAKQHYGSRTKTCFLRRVLLLFYTGHVICWPSHSLPLAPLSTTCEQMVHSRRRVIESPWRKCNCFSNYVLPATEQWESMRPQLFIENRERGRLFWGLTRNSLDHHSSDDWLTIWQQCSLIPVFTLCFSGRLSPSCKVVNSEGTKTTAHGTEASHCDHQPPQ